MVATERGYYGGKRRDPEERFAIASMDDFSERWMEAADGSVAPKAKAPAEPKAPFNADLTVEASIPQDWRQLHYTKRVQLAKAISGDDGLTADEANAIISAEADRRDAIARGITFAPSEPVVDEDE